MRKQRFYLPEDISINSEILLSSDISHHIRSVIRMKVGDIIYLYNNSVYEYSAKILEINKSAIKIHVDEQTEVHTESNLRINLAQVIGKGDKMDTVIQKATELGVSNIYPVYSQHSQIKYSEEKANTKRLHWEKIAISASSQSWRTMVPKVHHPVNFVKFLETIKSSDHQTFILHPGKNSISINEIRALNLTQLTVIIGPEGGFSEQEIDLATNENIKTIKLGPRILRTETAAIAIVSILQAIFGDY